MNTDQPGLIRIYIKISEEEYSFVKDVADNEGKPVATWLRQAIGCKLQNDGFEQAIFFTQDVSQSE